MLGLSHLGLALDSVSKAFGLGFSLIFLLFGESLESRFSDLLLLLESGLPLSSQTLSSLLEVLLSLKFIIGLLLGILSLSSEPLLVILGESPVVLVHLVKHGLGLLVLSLFDFLSNFGLLLALFSLLLYCCLQDALLLLGSGLSFSNLGLSLFDFNLTSFLLGLLSKFDKSCLLLCLGFKVVLLGFFLSCCLLDHGFFSLLVLCLGSFDSLDSG